MPATTTATRSQLSLPFGSHVGTVPTAPSQTAPITAPLSSDSTLSAAIATFAEQLTRRDIKEGTRWAMRHDLDTTGRILGMNRQVGSLAQADLERVTFELQATSQPSTVERRLSTFSQFVRWLTFKGCLKARLHVAVPKAVEKLPTVLSRDQVKALLEHTTQHRTCGTMQVSGDVRLAFLVRLILTTAMKRQDVLALKVTDLRLDATPPTVTVGKGTRARKIVVPAELNRFWTAYAEKYAPVERAFECSYKPLEEGMAEISKTLKWPATLGFTVLRWTAALRDLQSGMPPEQLRLKMGLSELQWTETLALLRRLAV
jgi:integrase/recombinase XerD